MDSHAHGLRSIAGTDSTSSGAPEHRAHRLRCDRAVAAIRGVFLLLRFPHADWLLIPVVETAYYAVGATLEGRPAAASSRQNA
jgi:hypothetical protein